MNSLENILNEKSLKRIDGIPQGYIPFFLKFMAEKKGESYVFIALNNEQLYIVEQQLKALNPKFKILTLPGWDCLPYDRAGPSQDIVNQRIQTFLSFKNLEDEFILLVTASSYLQKMPPLSYWDNKALTLKKGDVLKRDKVVSLLIALGYKRCDTVYESGDFAVRGHLIDVFLTGEEKPIRIDFFDQEIESFRYFEIDTQTTQKDAIPLNDITIKPSSEVLWDASFLDQFSIRYRQLEGDIDIERDEFYQSIINGRPFQGHEHFAPLSYDQEFLTLEEMLKEKKVTFFADYLVVDILKDQISLIFDYYKARLNPYSGEQIYKPLPPKEFYNINPDFNFTLLSPFVKSEATDVGARILTNLPSREHNPDYLDDLKEYILNTSKVKKVILAFSSLGVQERIVELLNIEESKNIEFLIISIEKGFSSKDFILLSDQDILGERQRLTKIKKRGHQRFFKELNDIIQGDLIVHKDHGIGRYLGLVTLDINENPHDCLILEYDGGNKLYLPVENMELISKYGNASALVQLDKLGTSSWKTKTGKVKKRIQLIADYLIEIAAKRSTLKGDVLTLDEKEYKEFCHRFPYVETDDQYIAIEDTFNDLTSGKPMDRLICGDVGFGKTEVALRAAYLAVSNQKQVAIVTPTTLLCRQHFRTFEKRFLDMPYKIAYLSRLLTDKQSKELKWDVKEGKVDILIATHAILAKDVDFKDLGLLIVDEEQHFGVNQKERLKQNHSNIHCLTLSATPIPRTLQMSLTGVRELSLITTPPVDRLPVRTFVLEQDPVALKEAILRECHRGGQVFYVCPHIEDQKQIQAFLKEILPNLRVVTVNGRMVPHDIEDAVSDFCDRHFDVLLATNIIESGIDMPSVNTIILHKAHLFGLATLYQLRGRVGRSKIQAYAYFTVPEHKILSENATKRLKILQSLDTLGAGFNLANHDLDLRGGGNLVGEEQSGHMKEVGMELYQQLLQETILKTKANLMGEVYEEDWMPQINLGGAVLIPERYISDLGLRLNLYKRLSAITDSQEINSFAVELVDRFGKFPMEVKNLLEVCDLKLLSKKAHVEKVEVGPKGFLLTFHNNMFSNPQKLLTWLQSKDVAPIVKFRADQKLFVQFKPEDFKKSYLICRKFLLNLLELI
ncbi:MAG: transcription-repair coupling factor [Proteobacteria bacterium]|nr:transcription-repair coupling factor [Pseudomonadota bacterium]